ncbi:MAG TPA: DUF3300 domain-containing protein [Candidatus Limnocylindrales bacterium]|nr:DUF3300 domain-containing protein [Candidatus Limnocylindrales bacterium]
MKREAGAGRLPRLIVVLCTTLLAAAGAGCDGNVGAGTETGEEATTLGSPHSEAHDEWNEEPPVAESGDRQDPPAYDQVSASDQASGNEPYEYDDAGAEPAQTETIFKADRLEQMVAPIALYPDSLMMQILVAATYPTEVVLADQWVKENRELTGEKLDEALAEQNWDESVKALVRLPDVLSRLANNLDWTRDLGDAFLAQKDDVLNAIQVMRNRACDLGNLKTTAEQKVVREPYQPPADAPAPPSDAGATMPPVGEGVAAPAVHQRYEVPPPDQVVRILPADPAVVHVPIYSPRLVYGPPPPTLFYPALFAPAPGYVATAAISFGVGLSIGAFLWTDVDWTYRRVLVRRYPRHYRPRVGMFVDADVPLVPWRHSYRHRRGVSYRTATIARRYSVVSRPAAGNIRDGGGAGVFLDRDVRDRNVRDRDRAVRERGSDGRGGGKELRGGSDKGRDAHGASRTGLRGSGDKDVRGPGDKGKDVRGAGDKAKDVRGGSARSRGGVQERDDKGSSKSQARAGKVDADRKGGADKSSKGAGSAKKPAATSREKASPPKSVRGGSAKSPSKSVKPASKPSSGKSVSSSRGKSDKSVATRSKGGSGRPSVSGKSGDRSRGPSISGRSKGPGGSSMRGSSSQKTSRSSSGDGKSSGRGGGGKR